MRPKIRRRNRDPIPVVEDDPLLQLMRDVDEADGASPDAIMPQSPREKAYRVVPGYAGFGVAVPS